MIFICIPVFNRYSHTKKCLDSIRKQTYTNYTIIVCDDGSTDLTGTKLKIEYPEVIVLNGKGDLWWAGATNLCVRCAMELGSINDSIFTLNNDTVLDSNTLMELAKFSDSKPLSLIACGNYFENDKDKLESTAFVKRNRSLFPLFHRPLFPWGQNIKEFKQFIFEINSVSGKGVLIPMVVFSTIGLYKSRELPQYHSDTEFSRRASEAGFKIFINLNLKIYTDQNASGIGQVNSRLSIREFFFSLFSLRSGNHLGTQFNRAKLIYKEYWTLYFVVNIFFIVFGFLKRYIIYKKRKLLNF